MVRTVSAHYVCFLVLFLWDFVPYFDQGSGVSKIKSVRRQNNVLS